MEAPKLEQGSVWLQTHALNTCFLKEMLWYIIPVPTTTTKIRKQELNPTKLPTESIPAA